jgi:hypothetical protein
VTSESSAAVNVELGWRCVLCGESTDSCIEANRLNPSPLVRSRPRVPGTPVRYRTVKNHLPSQSVLTQSRWNLPYT